MEGNKSDRSARADGDVRDTNDQRDAIDRGGAHGVDGIVDDVVTESVDDVACVLFTLGGRLFALPAASVIAAADVARPVRIPGAPDHVLGFVLVGERPVAAFDPSRFLGADVAGARATTATRMIVVRAAGMQAGLAVERALGIVGVKHAAGVDGVVETMHGAATLVDPAALLAEARA